MRKGSLSGEPSYNSKLRSTDDSADNLLNTVKRKAEVCPIFQALARTGCFLAEISNLAHVANMLHLGMSDHSQAHSCFCRPCLLLQSALVDVGRFGLACSENSCIASETQPWAILGYLYLGLATFDDDVGVGRGSVQRDRFWTGIAE